MNASLMMRIEKALPHGIPIEAVETAAEGYMGFHARLADGYITTDGDNRILEYDLTSFLFEISCIREA